MTMHKVLYQRDDIEKKEEEDSPILKTAWMHQYKD